MTRLLMTADSVGGVWQYACDLAAALATDHEVTIAHVGPGRPTAPAGIRLIDTGLPLDWLAASPTEVIGAAETLARLARDVRADFVQLNSPALAAGARFACPVVAVDHGCVATWWDAVNPGQSLPDHFTWHALMVGDGLRTADIVVTPTAAYGEAVRRRYRLPFAPVTVHNGRAFPYAVRAEPGEARASSAEASGTSFDRLRTNGGRHAAFTAGRLWDAAKATPLADAVASVLDMPFEAAGPTAGPNGEQVELRHLQHLGTLDQPALAARLAARPVFVSTARFEPFGLAVLEAAAAGCPLVLSDIPSFRELWDGAARFVAGDDPAAWAITIGEAAGDTALGDAAAARAARYTPAAMADGMRGVYAGLSPRRQAA